MALNIYGQLCGYCVQAAIVTTAGVDTPSPASDWPPIDWPALPSTASQWLLLVLLIAAVVGAWFLLKWFFTPKPPPPEYTPLEELDGFRWVRETRRAGDKRLSRYRTFVSSYSDIRKNWLKKYDVRFTCPALFDPPSPTDPALQQDQTLPPGDDFRVPQTAISGTPRKPLHFAFIITGQQVILHFWHFNNPPGFSRPLSLSQISRDHRGSARDDVRLVIRTPSGNISLKLFCHSGELNDVLGLLTENRQAAI